MAFFKEESVACSHIRNLFISKNLIEFFVLLITSKQELETSFRFLSKTSDQTRSKTWVSSSEKTTRKKEQTYTHIHTMIYVCLPNRSSPCYQKMQRLKNFFVLDVWLANITNNACVLGVQCLNKSPQFQRKCQILVQ